VPTSAGFVHTGVLSPRIKRQGRDADHWAPSTDEVTKSWDFTSTPPPSFQGTTNTVVPAR
jgi:hypothetical protein